MAVGRGHVESIDTTDWQPASLPAVRIQQPGGSDELLIGVMTPTPSTGPSSSLFAVLENASVSVLCSRRSFTNERVLHSILVSVPSGLDIDDLRGRLHSWAAN